MNRDDDVVQALRPDDPAGRLGALPLLADVPRAEIDWLMDRGEVRTYAPGHVVRVIDTPVDEMSIVLDGRIGLYVPRGGGERRVMAVESGFVIGVVPYSRMRTTPGTVVAETTVSCFVLHQRHFHDLVRDCPAITTALVHQMIDRAREYRAVQLHDERLLALGRLASGLAHELNNPAAGAASGARALEEVLGASQRAVRTLLAARPTAVQLEALELVRAQCERAGPKRSAIAMADREDEIGEWLEEHGIDPLLADELADSDVSRDALDGLADALPADTLQAAVTWMASTAAARDSACQIQMATARIRDLVGAVKGFTFMDREGVPEPVDIARCLADTLTVLEGKCRAKAVAAHVETADDLPAVHGYGSELNQVWQALIDNAIDAVGTNGSVTVTATTRGESVVVRIADDGPGIPEDVRPRVFDPFFTTKRVGEGAGLGLHQARRIVHLHHGDLDFRSEPGRTVFRVRLPVRGADSARPAPGGPTG